MKLHQTEINGMNCIIKDLHSENLVFTHVAGLFIVNEKLQNKFPECIAAISENIGDEILNGTGRLSKQTEAESFLISQDSEGEITQARIITTEDVKYTLIDTNNSIKWYWYVDRYYVNIVYFKDFENYMQAYTRKAVNLNFVQAYEKGKRQTVLLTTNDQSDIYMQL